LKKKCLLSSINSSSKKPDRTSIPLSSNCLIPDPETFGFGSLIPITTFLIPDLIIASVQGPVLP